MGKIIFLLLLAFFSQVFAQSGCGKRYLGSTKVVSGQTTRPHSWPWQVQLRRTTSGSHFCGGSLINDQWVITAAHCVYNRGTSFLNVRLGEHSLNANEAHQVDRTVERIFIHPSYSRSSLNYDVALIKLSSKVTLKPQVSPICLPKHGSSINEVTGTECYITGWGRTGASRPGATVLQEARLPVISNSKCRRYMGSRVSAQMVCAGFGGSSTVSGCFGDSGGPFVCRDKSSDRWYLHGAVSWGSRTCGAGENQFTVFARISEFVNWIKQYAGTIQPPPTLQPTTLPQTPPPPQTPPQPSPPLPTSSSSANCDFDKGTICSFENQPADFNWRINRGATPSVGTGPDMDISGKGYYIYTEASSPRIRGQKARISSPYLSDAQCLKFSYHMKGSGMGTLNVYVNQQRIYYESGDQGPYWVQVEIPISEQGSYKVLFEGIIGNNYRSDIAIDEIVFTPGRCSSQPSTQQTPETQPPMPTQPVTRPPQQTVNCNFDQGNTCSFVNDRSGDNFDWSVRSGSTPSGGTGPSRDVSGSGFYIYIETSSPQMQGNFARLTSPAISGAYCVKFSYHMYGAGMGSLTVYQKAGSSYLKAFSESGNQGNRWLTKELQLNSQNTYSVVFEGKRGSNYQSDIAIDEVSMIPGKCGSGGTPPPPGTPPTPNPPSIKCGEKGQGLSDFPKIVGGQKATPGEWPWQVMLLKGSFPFCGGSIVSNQYVITAAHCVRATDWSRVKVRVGEHELGKTEGHEQDISIARNGITVHPRYRSSTTDYDIAIIKLSRTIQHTQMIKPVCINRGTNFTGQRCYITGWGRLRSGGSSPKVLQEARVPIVTKAECQKSYGSRITDRMFCAGYSQGGTDSCQGDSGGPLVCRHNDGSWHLTGITSWGRGCALSGYYGVYAHVATLYPWVNQVTGL